MTGQGCVAGEAGYVFRGDAGATLLGSVMADNAGALHAADAFTIPTCAWEPAEAPGVHAGRGAQWGAGRGALQGTHERVPRASNNKPTMMAPVMRAKGTLGNEYGYDTAVQL